MAKRKWQMAKVNSQERFSPFDLCHLAFDLLVLGGGSGTLPPQRARRPRLYLGFLYVCALGRGELGRCLATRSGAP
jgi:hypothetical protein